MLRKLLATGLILGICVAVTGCEKEETTTTGGGSTEAATNPDTGDAVTPAGTEAMEIEQPEGAGGGQ
jgi:hypothetical protein